MTASDSAQLQQVFLNILNNAIDAIGKDGEIHLKTRHLAQNNEIGIEIHDTGPGIPKEILNRSSTPSSPPRRWARAPAWAFPFPTASWKNWGAG